MALPGQAATYSARIALIGSNRIARSVGRSVPASAMSSVRPVTAANVGTSAGVTPIRSVWSERPAKRFSAPSLSIKRALKRNNVPRWR